MPEKQNTEWKSKWKDEYLAWLCGFANAQGGVLYLGMDDRGEVVGLPNARKLMEDLPNKIRDALGIIADVNLRDDDGKSYIEITVPAYPIAISYKGVCYYRSGSTNQTLTGPELERFMLRRRGATWDNMPFPGFTMEDVDDGVVKRFRRWAAKKGRIEADALDESKELLMERLHLINNGYLTNAAMLLFAEDPERWLLGAYTKIGFFETDADLIYQDEIHGSLLDQIDRIIEVVHLKYMKAKITYEGMQRIERYFVPDAALREALLNALCHKDYSIGIPIQVSVYDDRLYIANCGSLPETWTAENLMGKHASRPFNPNIAHVFYLAGFIESWGRGIEKICNACREENVPLPEYTVHPGDIMVKFTAANNEKITYPDKVGDRVGDRLGKREKELIALLTEDPAYTYVQLAQKIGISEKSIFTYMKALKAKGCIRRVGSTKNGHWEILL